MTDNIVSLPTPMNVLADRIRDALKRVEQSRIEWIKATVDLAVTLKEARERFPSNERFAIWLAETGLDSDLIGHQSRAALINMAGDLALTRIVLQETKRNSWEHIWLEEIKPRLTHLRKTDLPAPKAPQPSITSAESPKIDEPSTETFSAERRSKMTERTGFADAPFATELYGLFRQKRGRRALARLWLGRGGKQAWEQLIVPAYRAGLIVPNDSQIHEPTLSLLFPLGPVGFTRQYDLTNQKQRTHVRDVLLPKMITCKDQLLVEPDRIREILNTHDATQHAKLRAEVNDRRREQALATMARDQQELVVFGTTVWPRLDNNKGPYDYDQIRAAIWTFRDQLAWNKITNDNSPGSIGIRIRLSMKWYNEYLMRVDPLRESPCRRVFNLVFWLSKLYEAAPDAECKWPAYPTAEAEW